MDQWHGMPRTDGSSFDTCDEGWVALALFLWSVTFDAAADLLARITRAS